MEPENKKNFNYSIDRPAMIYDIDNLPELDDGTVTHEIISHNYGQSAMPTMNELNKSGKKQVATEKKVEKEGNRLMFDYHMAYDFDDLPELDDGKTEDKINHNYGEKILPKWNDVKQTKVSEMELEEAKETDVDSWLGESCEAYRASDKKWIPCKVLAKHLTHYIVKWDDAKRGSVLQSELREHANSKGVATEVAADETEI